MTSSSNWPGRYLPHSARRFSTERSDRGVCPVMYSRRMYRAPEPLRGLRRVFALRFFLIVFFAARFTLFRFRPEVQAHQNPLCIRQITDNFANGLRQIAH